MNFPSGIKIGVLCLSMPDEELNIVCKGGGFCPSDVNGKQVSCPVGPISGEKYYLEKKRIKKTDFSVQQPEVLDLGSSTKPVCPGPICKW